MHGSGESVKVKRSARAKSELKLDRAVAKDRLAGQRVGKIQLTVRAGDADGLRFYVRQSDLHAHQLQAGVLHAPDFAR